MTASEIERANERRRRRSGFREHVIIAPLVRGESIEEVDEGSSSRSGTPSGSGSGASNGGQRPVMAAPTVSTA